VCFRVQAFKRAHDPRLPRARTPCIYFYSSLCKSLTRCQACRSASVIHPSRRRVISVRPPPPPPPPTPRSVVALSRDVLPRLAPPRENASLAPLSSGEKLRVFVRLRGARPACSDVSSNPRATGRERNLTRDFPLIEKPIVRKWRSYNRHRRRGDLAQQE